MLNGNGNGGNGGYVNGKVVSGAKSREQVDAENRAFIAAKMNGGDPRLQKGAASEPVKVTHHAASAPVQPTAPQAPAEGPSWFEAQAARFPWWAPWAVAAAALGTLGYWWWRGR